VGEARMNQLQTAIGEREEEGRKGNQEGRKENQARDRT